MSMSLLEYFEAKKLLDKYGIRSIDSKYVTSAADASKFAHHSRIVLKLISDKALHKSKAGLVKLNLSGDEEIRAAYKELTNKGRKLVPYKIIAQKMAFGGVEIIVGGRTDPQFGKFILLGLGGIYVEVFKDFVLRLCPITKIDAEEMIAQLKSNDIVTYKGKNVKILTELLLRASRMLSENGDISELDLNPIMIKEDSYEAVDIRILK
jgi:succinyl-CoA synthetase beta subunit